MSEGGGTPGASSSNIGSWLGDWQRQRAHLQSAAWATQDNSGKESHPELKGNRHRGSPFRALVLEAIGYDSIVSAILPRNQAGQLSRCLKHLGKIRGHPIEYDEWIRPVVLAIMIMATVPFSKPTPGQILLNLKYRLSSQRGLRLAQGILAGVGPLLFSVVSKKLVRTRPDLHIGLALSILRALQTVLFILRGKYACLRDWLLRLPMEWASETGWRPEVNHPLMDIQLLFTELGNFGKLISKVALCSVSFSPSGKSRTNSQVGLTQCGFCDSATISVPVALVICAWNDIRSTAGGFLAPFWLAPYRIHVATLLATIVYKQGLLHAKDSHARAVELQYKALQGQGSNCL